MQTCCAYMESQEDEQSAHIENQEDKESTHIENQDEESTQMVNKRQVKRRAAIQAKDRIQAVTLTDSDED